MAIPNVDPIIVAPTPNPLRPDDSIDHDALARNVQRWLRTPLSGFVVGSAGGEEYFLGDEERVAAVKTVAEAHEGRRFVIGGIDNPSTTNTLRLAEAMFAAGADLVRVRIPIGGDVVAYYREVVEKIPDPRSCDPPDVRQTAICGHSRAKLATSVRWITCSVTSPRATFELKREPVNSCRLTRNSGYATAAFFSTER